MDNACSSNKQPKKQSTPPNRTGLCISPPLSGMGDVVQKKSVTKWGPKITSTFFGRESSRRLEDVNMKLAFHLNGTNIRLLKDLDCTLIKQTLMKMDLSVLTEELIEMIRKLIPTDDELAKIKTDLADFPGVQLHLVEEYMLSISEIEDVGARLTILQYIISYKEMRKDYEDLLEKGLEEMKNCKTFINVLTGILQTGNHFSPHKLVAFKVTNILKEVIGVKDKTAAQKSLLYHLCRQLNELVPESTDILSEIPHFVACAQVDWDHAESTFSEMKAAWIEARNLLENISIDDPAVRQQLEDLFKSFAREILTRKLKFEEVKERFLTYMYQLGNDFDKSNIQEFCVEIMKFAKVYSEEYHVLKAEATGGSQ